MNKRTFLLLTFLLSATGLMAQSLSWNDPDLEKQVSANIEKYRKSDGVITVVDEKGRPVAGATVTIRQQTSEFKFGCNLFAIGQLATPELNQKYESAFLKLFNFATIPFYWAELEPLKDSLRFREGSVPMWRRPPPDELVKWCKEHNILIKGHPLLYIKSKFMPSWISREDPETLKVLAQKRMTQLAERYGKDVAVWDVVNEDVAREKHPNVWHAAPDDYLAWAFKEACRLFPKTSTLLINDETRTSHDSTWLYVNHIKGLQKRGIRVDGIGIQFHMLKPKEFLSGQFFPPDQLRSAYRQLGQFKKPLWITEITVPSRGENGFQNQAAIVSNLYKLWFSEPLMKGITWWNLGDGTAFGTENSFLGGLLDSAMNPKPAFVALDRLINHEWKTNLTLTTDAKGQVRFRGFHGGYSLALQKGGMEKAAIPLDLPGGRSRTQTTVVLADEAGKKPVLLPKTNNQSK